MQKKDDTIEIPEEIRKYLSNAKRHHYVPEFLIRRFSPNPQAKQPQVYSLNLKTGAVVREAIINCAVIGHYNTLSRETGMPSGFPEALFSYVEGLAAPVVEKLVCGDVLSVEERSNFSLFIAFQQQRTPRQREWQRFMYGQAIKFWLLKQIYERPEDSRKSLQKDLGREPTEIEIDEFRHKMAEDLNEERIVPGITTDQEILGMFTAGRDLPPLIYEMDWILLRAPQGQNFILSDDPLVCLDPANPDGPRGWRSSPTVEVTFPLDPQLCLLLRQPPRTQREVIISPEQILDINLRTYAGAKNTIFGLTEHILENTHTAAQTNSIRVDLYRPKPPAIHVIEQIGEDKPFKAVTIPGPNNITIRRNRPNE